MSTLLAQRSKEDRSITSKISRWNWLRARKLIVKEEVSGNFISIVT